MAMNPRRITRTADHQYGYEGQWYPGATGVLKVLGATFSQASRYGANQAATAAADLVESGVILELFNAQGRDGFIKGIAGSATKARDQAAQLGTDVHELANDHVNGKPMPPSLPPAITNRVQAYAAWWASAGWRLRASEAMLINPEYKYGGTLDLLAYDAQGRSTLADIKTGSVYREAILQLRAYGDATYIETDQGFFSMPHVDRFVILHVTEAGVREIEIPMTALEEVAWVACLDLHQWMQTQKGRSL